MSQPGPYDGGTEADRIGTLLRYLPLIRGAQQPDCPMAVGVQKTGTRLVKFIRPNYEMKLVKYTRETNLIDAAVARPDRPGLIEGSIMEIGEVKGNAAVEAGIEVLKSGRSSGLTQGKVTATGASLKVELSDDEYGWFSDQIVSDMKVSPGDSGSLTLNRENQAVGLIFAGSDKHSIFNRIENVLDKLDITF